MLSRYFKKSVFLLVSVCSLALFSTVGGAEEVTSQPQVVKVLPVLDVYKNPSCGCCNDWVDHVREAGYDPQTHTVEDMTSLKSSHNIARQYQSCHTAVTEQGFVFEGHVPARLMKKFLQDKPEGAIGLSVPGMPVGSPGMEMGERFMPYKVLLLMSDGSAQVYAEVNSPADQ